MHRRQNPHTSNTSNSSSSSRPEYNNNTSPPSTRTPAPTTTSTTSTTTHRRQPSSSSTTNTTTTTANAKKGSLRPQRPNIHHRKSASTHLLHTTHTTHHNHNNNNHNRRKSSHQSVSKLLGSGSGPANWSAQPDDDKREMATSFLQYCAMCEKQITVPSNSVLYCSESCRRKDSCKPLSASSYTYTMTSSSSSTPPSSPPLSPRDRDIVAPLTPTRSASPTNSSSTPSHVLSRIPSDLHDAKSDLDPTEWKPVIHHNHHYHRPQAGRRTPSSSTSLSSSSEAWTFLSQFHHEPMTGFGLRRSPTHRSSAVSLLSSTMAPSLTNTPSTMASSLSSSTGSPLDYTISGYDTAAAAAAAGATRPLPPRHNPSYTGATKGVELVVPHIAAPVMLTTAVPTPTTTAAGVVCAAGESLASSPTDSHDDGVWLKSHHRHRQSVPTVLVEKAH